MTDVFFDPARQPPPPRPRIDPWAWWMAKLAGHDGVEMNPNEPHAGFYREPKKEHYGARKTFRPVAYWPDENGVLHCRIGDEDIDISDRRFLELWPRVGDHPVSEKAYRDVAEKEALWPDEHELVDMQGHNRPPDDRSLEGLQAAIEPLAKDAEIRLRQGDIQTQDEADRIANLADRLSELWKQADDARRAERKPHDEELKLIQKRWAPILLLAETYKNLKYKLLTPWLQKLEAELKRAAEEAAAAGEPPSETRRPRAGTRGRAQTLKSTKKAKITDYNACLEFFRESEDIKSCVQMLANRAVRSGITVPGAEVIEEEKAV